MNILKYLREFGIKITLSKIIRSLLYKNNSRFAWYVNKKNEICIQRYLNKIFSDNQIDDKEFIRKKTIISVAPIWVMWFQGLENAPDIVKICVNSIKKYAPNHEVIIINEKNYRDYIELPEFIENKFDMGIISRTHLSDIIRLNVLYLYGGMWIDATVFVSGNIPEKIFEMDFYSINFGKVTKDPSHGRWTTFLMAGKERNPLFEKALKYHYAFWREHDMIVDYIMFDYIIDYCYRTDEECRKLIDKIEINNSAVFELRNELNEKFVKKLPLQDDTIFNKLSWKMSLIEEENGRETNYGELLKRYKKSVRI